MMLAEAKYYDKHKIETERRAIVSSLSSPI
jgi:hypothetical protein